MDIILRSIIAFFTLLLFTRILGKKQMNQITYFDYITGITLGSIAASMSVEEHVTLKIGAIALAAWSALALLIEFVSLKSYFLRNFFDGEPDIIIKNGVIQQKVLRKSNLNMDDVAMLLREKDVFSISHVEYAILEPHGKLSVLKKPAPFLPTDLIIDGKIIRRNLTEINKDEKWLQDELARHNTTAVKVFYMALQEDGSTHVDLFDN